jgi:hypothetical protein
VQRRVDASFGEVEGAGAAAAQTVDHEVAVRWTIGECGKEKEIKVTARFSYTSIH